MPDSTVTITGENTITVATVGLVGPEGPQGEQGPPGSGGDVGDWSYYHTQGAASSSWVISHSLGFRPNATVFTSAHQMVEGDVVHDSENQLTITFSSAFSGYATLA